MFLRHFCVWLEKIVDSTYSSWQYDAVIYDICLAVNKIMIFVWLQMPFLLRIWSLFIVKCCTSML